MTCYCITGGISICDERLSQIWEDFHKGIQYQWSFLQLNENAGKKIAPLSDEYP